MSRSAKVNGVWTTVAGNGNFVGTIAQWNALSAAQKNEYDTVDLTDDFNGYSADSTPTQNSTNLVTSGGVYSAIASAVSDVNYYLETSVYTTADGVDTFEFTDAKIATGNIDGPYCDIPLISPVAMVKSGTTLSVSFNSSDGVGTCGIYLK